MPSDADEPHFAMLADNSLHGFVMLTVWFVAIGVPLLITRAEYLSIGVKWPQAFWIDSQHRRDVRLHCRVSRRSAR